MVIVMVNRVNTNDVFEFYFFLFTGHTIPQCVCVALHINIIIIGLKYIAMVDYKC